MNDIGYNIVPYSWIRSKLDRTTSLHNKFKETLLFFSYKFQPSRWNKCSTCGRVGFMTRKIFCVNETEGKKLSYVNETLCEGKYKPINKSKCYIPCRSKLLSFFGGFYIILLRFLNLLYFRYSFLDQIVEF